MDFDKLKIICIAIIAVMILLSGMLYTWTSHIERMEKIRYETIEMDQNND